MSKTENINDMKKVDDIIGEIFYNLGRLTSYCVLTYEDSINIMKALTIKEYDWMSKCFSEEDIAGLLQILQEEKKNKEKEGK